MIIHADMPTSRGPKMGARARGVHLIAGLVAVAAAMSVGCSPSVERSLTWGDSELDVHRAQKLAALGDINRSMARIAGGERPASITPSIPGLPVEAVKWNPGGGGEMPAACESDANPGACWGQQLYVGNCAQCHSVDGTASTGPTWKGIWGTERDVMANGEKYSVVADEAYVRRSIVKPNAEIVAEYMEGTQMASQGHLNEEQVDALVAYIQSLGGVK